MRRKRLQIILLKNSITLLIIAVVSFFVLIGLFKQFPIFEKLKCNKIGNVQNLNEKIDELYNDETTNVKYEADKLYYLGFDLYEDGKQKGAYYYTIKDKSFMICLIKTKEPKSVLTNYKIKGKIIKDIPTAEHIINQLGNENEISFDDMYGFASEYVISEIDYPSLYIRLVYIAAFAPLFVCIAVVLYIIFVFIHPEYDKQSRQLREYGEPREIINEINNQLGRRVVLKKNNIYITMDYMIVSYLTRTDIIKLDCIEYLSKNIVEKTSRKLTKKGIVEETEEVYRITLSKPENIFYEVDFKEEKLVDEVVKYIRGLK